MFKKTLIGMAIASTFAVAPSFADSEDKVVGAAGVGSPQYQEAATVFLQTQLLSEPWEL